MSLLKAKRIAELKEELESVSTKLATKRDAYRKTVNTSVLESFSDHMKQHDFDISTTVYGARAVYKDLKVELKLAGPEDRFIAVFHSFDLIVNGKDHFVRVVPKYTGTAPEAPYVSSETDAILERQIQAARHNLENEQLESFTYDCSLRPGAGQSKPAVKATMAEVLDHVLA
jgi:hypothetical protein